MANPPRFIGFGRRPRLPGIWLAICVFLPVPVIAVPVIALFIAILATGASSETAKADGRVAASDALTVKPEKCISLRQGLICYQRIRFEWTLAGAGEYCLIEDSAETPIKCWSQPGSGSLHTEFTSRDSKTYFLIDQTDNKKLASATVQVAWVYRSKKRSRGRWRLF